MTHGLDPARLARQIHEIDRLNEKFKNFTILRGIEVDILKDGSLDLPDSSLAKLDVVVAAVHSHFDLPRKAQTDRVVAAKLAGVKLAVSTDAHSIDAFQCMRFGIDQARRAWLTANDVLNTRPLTELRKLLKR
jgi:DNA polymerase (family X)